MHFITGGAFNGKSKWVKKHYDVSKWISAYKGDVLLNDCSNLVGDVVVLEGIENWTKKVLKTMNLKEAREFLNSKLEQWEKWEKQVPNREVILIGTDIMKGIVPIAEEERDWRDLTGWFYQDIVQKCDRVDIIWYGINQTIKGESCYDEY